MDTYPEESDAHYREAAGRNELRGLPKHVAIIMDGNGRWATQHGLPRVLGHREGVKALKPIVKESARLGIEVLTVYAFSTENWTRPVAEVDTLMSLLEEFLHQETPELKAEGVRIKTIGNIAALPEAAQRALSWARAETSQETRMVLNIALNYGGRDELIRAVNRWLGDTTQRDSHQSLDAVTLEQYLDTAGLPDPDLLIRSSGEIRLSNFLLWQLAYAEIYITDTLWPDFTADELSQALDTYQQRDRRFGGIG